MDDGGHVRYLGRSSGFYLLQGSRTYQNGVFRFSGYGPKTTSSSHKSDHHVNPLAVPPIDLSEHLMDLYFQHFYPMLPLFYKRQLTCSMNSDEPPSPLLLNSIYAIASRISSDPRVRSDPTSQTTAGDIFFERAKCLLDDYYDVPTISTVQSLLLLSSHQQGTLKFARAWLYSGMAFRMALDLGLHRNCDHWQISSEEKEQRKRVFWSCFIMDRLTAAIYGRTLCFDERDIDVPFPSGDDDEPIETDTNRPSPRILDIFINCIKISDIMGHVLKNIYYTRAHHFANGQYTHSLTSLHQQLTSWIDNLPPSLQYMLPDTEIGETAPDPPLVVGQLHMIYYTTMILLHRSFIPGSSKTTTESHSPSSSYDFCVSGARSILNIINIMRGENHLKCVLNSSVYFAFTAGIIFIKMASSSEEFEFAFDAKVNVNKIMRSLDAMEETWPNASRCRIILGELAGLTDINLEDNKYVPRKIGKPAKPPPAISVPNSPEPSSLDYSYADDKMKNTGLSDQQHVPTATLSTSSTASNHLDDHQLFPSSQRDQHPYSMNAPIKPTADPFAAPDSVMTPHGQSQAKADPFGAAFSGVPTSLDVEAWDQYFAHHLFSTTSSQQIFNGNGKDFLIPSNDMSSTSHHPQLQEYAYPHPNEHYTTTAQPTSTSSSPLPSSTTVISNMNK
ncbi:fungal-specific transcription factor domain-domain-containing protein [Absidia repens]|uniref:Fungal-specific transcription factor domain-domain-containing protein n=1 Tax=Absidia repens TaxID=90262 RepID=A0A1X2IUJ1_9FUNG|nr:fungal-specific transcription factor domain-domain-containing protein [Absidia repens]